MATRGKKADLQKHLKIGGMYKSGMTLAEIGAIYGVGTERIRQVVVGLGIARTEGGAAIRSFLLAQDKAAAARQKATRDDARCFQKWGMPLDQYRAHVKIYGNTTTRSSPLDCYRMQRNNAKTRGVAWNFTFQEWWALWQESGKWAVRGRGHGYVMARYGDAGSYEPNNVYICTQAQNASDSYITRPASMRFPNSKVALRRSRKAETNLGLAD